VHLATNYKAVTSVTLLSLNRQRANIVLSHLFSTGVILSPTQVSRKERIFEWDGVLRWEDGAVIGHCTVGVTVERLLDALSKDFIMHMGGHMQVGSRRLKGVSMGELVSMFKSQGYILWFSGSGASAEAVVVLKEGCTPVDQIKAWGQALLMAQRARERTLHKEKEVKARGKMVGRSQPQLKEEDEEEDDGSALHGRRILAEIRSTLEEVTRVFDTFAEGLRTVGWDLDIAALETRTGVRAEIAKGKSE
jgi:hypothetical protein